MRAASKEVRFHLFGDESSNEEIAAYGVVIAPASRIAELEAGLRAAKIAARGPADAPIHCKELLHGDRRARSAWSHLSGAESFALLEDVALRARAAGARAWIGYSNRREMPDFALFEGGDKLEITPLHLSMFAYWAAMAPVHDIVPHAQTRAWLDPNKNRLKLIGKGMQQFRLSQGFFSLNHNDVRFEPEPVDTSKPPLLQLADIVAHCGARALSRAGRKQRHEAVLARVRPGLSAVVFNATGPMLFSVKTKTAAVAELRSDLVASGS